MAEGWIYILTNPNCPTDLLRVGATTKSPEEAARELSKKTHLPTPFEVGFQIKVQNTDRAEKLVHKVLEKYHLQHDAGFFKVNLENAIQMVEEAASYFKIDPKEEKPAEFIKTIRKQKPDGDDGGMPGLEKVRCRGCDRDFFIPTDQEVPTVSCPYCRETVGTDNEPAEAVAEKEPIKDIDKLLGEVKASPRKDGHQPKTIMIRPAVPTGDPDTQKEKKPPSGPVRLWVLLAVLLAALVAAGYVLVPDWIDTPGKTPGASGEHGPEMPAPPEPPSPVEPSSEVGNSASDKASVSGLKTGRTPAVEPGAAASQGTTAPDPGNPQTATALIFKDSTVQSILVGPVSENTVYYRLPAGDLADIDPARIIAAILGNGDIVPLRDTGRTNDQVFFRIDQENLSKNGRLSIKTVILNGGSVIPCEEAWIRKGILYYEHNQGVIGLSVDSVDVVYYRSDNGAVGVAVKVDGLLKLAALKRLVSGVRP